MMETIVRDSGVADITASKNAVFPEYAFTRTIKPFSSGELEFDSFNDDAYQTIVKNSEIKASISKNNEYLDFLSLNTQYRAFDELLSEFLLIFNQERDYKPLFYELGIFKFPEENYQGPILKIVYPDSEKFSVVKLRDEFLMNLKDFLAIRSRGIDEFKSLRNGERKYRFIVRRG
jgi:hypothetical protein